MDCESETTPGPASSELDTFVGIQALWFEVADVLITEPAGGEHSMYCGDGPATLVPIRELVEYAGLTSTSICKTITVTAHNCATNLNTVL